MFLKWCVLCGVPGVDLCARCTKKLPTVVTQRCTLCHSTSDYGKTHPQCYSQYGVFPNYCYSFFHYNTSTRSIVRKAKFHPDPHIFQSFMEAIAPSRMFPLITLIRESKISGIIPVPISRERLFLRGYNPALIISHFFRRYFHIPLYTFLKRSSNNPLQSQTKYAQRAKNIEGAFFTEPHPKNIAGKRFIVCDDVITTGVTAHEISKVLGKNNCTAFIWLTLCRSF